MNDNQQFQEVGKGGLFINKSKQPGSNQPDFTGRITLQDGTEQRISGWNASGQNSGPYINIKLSQKSGSANAESQPAAQGDSIFPTAPTDEPSVAFGQQVQQPVQQQPVQQQPNQQQLMSQGQDEIPF
jgi:hypothetical protein